MSRGGDGFCGLEMEGEGLRKAEGPLGLFCRVSASKSVISSFARCRFTVEKGCELHTDESQDLRLYISLDNKFIPTQHDGCA